MDIEDTRSLEIPPTETAKEPEWRQADTNGLCQCDSEVCTFNEPVKEPPMEAYPYDSDGAMRFENIRATMKTLPRYIIDFMGRHLAQFSPHIVQLGYVPNSVIRSVIGKWVNKYIQVRRVCYSFPLA